VPLALVEVVVVVVVRNALGGGWVGSATKAQIPTVVACAWVVVVATAAPKECMPVPCGTPVRAPKAGKLVVIRRWQSPELARVLILHDVVHDQAR
jgi:hypothetical protein